MADLERPPATKIAWCVWLRDNPSVSVEVSERFWIDARVLGACKISEQEGRAVFFDELEAEPVEGGVVRLAVGRMRREAQAPAVVR